MYKNSIFAIMFLFLNELRMLFSDFKLSCIPYTGNVEQ